MGRSSRFRLALALPLLLFLLVGPASAQDSVRPTKWDFSAWVAGETGEELLNSFSEAQIFTAGVFVGRFLTAETVRGWRRGRFEYGFGLIPVFRQFQPQTLYGGGFEPVVLRWNSGLRVGRVSPYIELAGGGVLTNRNLPPGDTADFNFTARGGGGIQFSGTPKRAIDVGVQWSHISNANLGVNNPEFNGIQVSLAYHWFK